MTDTKDSPPQSGKLPRASGVSRASAPKTPCHQAFFKIQGR